MQKLIIIIIAVFFTMSSLTAQYDKRENLKAYKTAYITQQLDLSSKEAEKFWPIYNVYQKEIFQLKVLKIRAAQKKIRDKGGIDTLNDDESEQLLADLIQNEQALVKTKKELYNSLKKVISSKKILKLYRAEHEFNKKLLAEFRKKRIKEKR